MRMSHVHVHVHAHVYMSPYTPLHPLTGGLLLHGLLADRLALEPVALHAPGQGPRSTRPHEGPVRLTRPARRHLIPSAEGTGPDEGVVVLCVCNVCVDGPSRFMLDRNHA